jgi:phospholipid/cholesterol/gamma-HCH transport system substrate-binding protein
MPQFSRPASHQPSATTIVVAALAAALAAGALAYLAWVAPRGVPGLKYYDVDAEFANAAQIADLAPVRMAGRNVGQVTTSEYRDGHAVLRLALYPGNGPLRSDTRARIRLQGLLGGKYVELLPGRHGRTLASGDTLPARQTSTAVDLISVLQAFDKPARLDLQTSVRGLGEGFLGRGGQLNRWLVNAPGFTRDLGSIASGVNTRTGAAARFAPSAQSLTAAYDPVRDELAAGFAPQNRVMEAFASERPALRATLDAAPGSLRALRGGLDAAIPLLDETAGLARAAIKLTRPAPAALRATRELLRAGAPALRDTNPTLTRLARAVPSTLAFLARIDPVVAPVRSTLTRSLGPLGELGISGCDVLSFASNWRSALSFGVATGNGDLMSGEPGLGGLTSLRVRPVRLLAEGNSDVPSATPPSRNAYPAPCTATKEQAR